MGVDADHMGWASLSQAIPPAMAQLVAAQMAMHQAHREFGVPIITYDDVMLDPDGTRATLRRWLRGAGCDAAGAGLELVERVARSAGAAETGVGSGEADAPNTPMAAVTAVTAQSLQSLQSLL